MAFTQIPTSVTIINSGLIGYNGISLTDITLSSQSLIASGSGIEISGSFFKAGTDITPEASSWSAISSLQTTYITLTPSGTAGSQILTAEYTIASPIWSTTKQGWYSSAGSNVRYVASVYKLSATSYQTKFVIPQINSGGDNGNIVMTSKFDIPVWNMYSEDSKVFSIYKEINKIISTDIYIISDFYASTGNGQTPLYNGGSFIIGTAPNPAGLITRTGGGLFDASTYSAIVSPRGFCRIQFTL